jgi:hypothetical protein
MAAPFALGPPGSACHMADDFNVSPFQYYRTNGTVVTSGVVTSVDLPHGGGDQRVCVYADAACSAVSTTVYKANGDSTACCVETDAVSSAADVWLYPFIAFLAAFVVMKFVMAKVRERRLASVPAAEREEAEKSQHPLAVVMNGWPTWRKYLFVFIFFAAITALVFEASIMPKQIQMRLSPSERSAQMAMSSFLTPVEEIFAFLEDSILVKVGYAIAAGRLRELNALIHVSTIGGATCAIIAFVLMLALAYVDASAKWALAPSSAANAPLAKVCSLLPSADMLVDAARVYWLVSAAAWLPKFVSKGLFGFFAGTNQLTVYLAPIVISATVPIGIWFGFQAYSQPSIDGEPASFSPLTLLSIAYTSGDWLILVGYIGYFAFSSELRQTYALSCLCCRRRRAFGDERSSELLSGLNVDGNEKVDEVDADYGGVSDACDGDGDGGEDDSTMTRRVMREVVIDGARLMVVDLAVQLSLTITTYIAASQGNATIYKLAAAQAAYYSFGPQYLFSFLLMVKLIGAQMLASGKTRQFLGMFGFATAITVVLAITAVVAAHFRGVPVALDYGQRACIYASDAACAPLYAQIFDGEDSLAHVFLVFGPTVGLQMLFELFRAGLAVCHDFTFLAKASAACFVVVYVPAILVAHYGVSPPTAVGYYIAMYLPHFAMIVAFAWRLWSHCKALARGGKGPWSVHMKRGSVNINAVANDDNDDGADNL